MSVTQWDCPHCGFDSIECSRENCPICWARKLPTQCTRKASILPVHPPPIKRNVSKGIAVGTTPRRGGRRNKRKNKTRKNKK